MAGNIKGITIEIGGNTTKLEKALKDVNTTSREVNKELKDIEPMLADCKADGLKYPLLTQCFNFFYLYYIDKYDFFSKNSLWAVDRATDTVVNLVQTSDYADFVKMMRKKKESQDVFYGLVW